MMNRFLPVLLVTLLVTLAAHAGDDLNPVTVKTPGAHPPIPLAVQGRASITLCLMDTPDSRYERLAIAELQSCFEAIFGERMPVLRGTMPDDDTPALVIGDCPAVRDLGIDPDTLPIEGFVIKTAPRRVFIVGHDDAELGSHGTAWGVYEFLERVLDVRWYWPSEHGGRTLTPRDTQRVEPMWIQDAPVYRKRAIWPNHLPHLRELQTALRGGDSWPIRLVVHAPHNWGPVFKQDRPEIFELNEAGQRHNKMLCYGNPLTLQTYLEVIEKHMTGQSQPPEAAQIIHGNAVTVSPWDVGIACQCDDCQALWDADAGRYGSASPILEHFVRELAEQVQRRWPELVVIYLPYLNYTLAASDKPFPGNVEVQLCGMPGLALYKEPAVWDQFQGNIDRWAELTDRPVQTWDYSCWPLSSTRAPYQYPHVLKRYYLENRDQIVGSFINGEGDHWPRSSFSLYCWLKLLWNPEFDVDAAADRACQRLFGPAAKPMRELWRLQADRWENSRFPDGRLAAEHVYQLAFTAPVVEQMRGLVKQARDLAADAPAVLDRIDYYTSAFPAFYREYEFVVEGKGMTPLKMKKIARLPDLDGRLDEPQWDTAEAVRFKVYDKQRKAAREANFPTTVRGLWLPGRGVVFGFTMSEPNPDALRDEKRGRDDGGLWHQDCVEIFLDTSGTNSGEFVQLIITAGYAVFDAKSGDATWQAQGLQFATYRGDDLWSLEVLIPAETLGVSFEQTAAAGRRWYGQFTRHRISDGQGGTENQKMNANQGGFNSNTGDFAELIFVE
jgi:hypothetical protein